MKVLFVCTGNSCRSPIAAALFKKMAKNEGINVEVESCGTSTLVGMSASKEAVEVLRNEGIDISGHKSKALSKELIDWADLILVMEKRHKENIEQSYSYARDKVFLLTEYAHLGSRDIIDPIGKPPEVYEALSMDLKFYLEKVIARLKNENKYSQ